MGADGSRPLPGDVTIRRATTADISQLKSFRCSRPAEPWTTAPELTVQMQVPGWIAQGDTLVVVAERAGAIVGVIAISHEAGPPIRATSQVLAVALGHQREYIGFNLKLRAMATAADAGARTVVSEVDAENHPMLRCNEIFDAVTESEPSESSLLLNVIRVGP